MQINAKNAIKMEWAPSRRADVASKGQLGELKCEVGLPL